MRILHVSDLHGSTKAFELTKRLYRELGADLLIVSGDLTGKCVCNLDSVCKCVWGRRKDLSMGRDKFEASGGYVVDASNREIEARAPGLLAKAAHDRVKQWLESLHDINYFVIAGNVDHWLMNEALKEASKPMDFRGLRIDGCSLVPYTPFGTYREGSEEDVWECLPHEADILVSHTPPRGVVDVSNYHGGGHVGSTSVRKWIEEKQPLLSLHGHIHESRGYGKIGRTVVVNPGSEAEWGKLYFAIIDLEGDHVEVKLGEREYY
ncbi:hypothetical protein EYM_04125 [Ignicoccus islandicus DSM 13165]|uniref:Calcineurin-like phosphoesterase domain-containing protein n=1 Tax=Ignicoccus islandicus DSM 13165 TaxID=940295 RepID=A0A0U3EDF8_9CREN|nr:metallophosphoesterase [Ignicoccus islandicus]ALU12467.1 hypothetical protein EYM_04125 [Ignicoccus islandicus DSM 13165]